MFQSLSAAIAFHKSIFDHHHVHAFTQTHVLLIFAIKISHDQALVIVLEPNVAVLPKDHTIYVFHTLSVVIHFT